MLVTEEMVHGDAQNTSAVFFPSFFFFLAWRENFDQTFPTMEVIQSLKFQQ